MLPPSDRNSPNETRRQEILNAMIELRVREKWRVFTAEEYMDELDLSTVRDYKIVSELVREVARARNRTFST